ncbi:podoplanin [Lycodopsis pacificus]
MTEEAVVETETYAPVSTAPGLNITDPPETEGSTEAADVAVQPTDAANAETGEDVVVEDTAEGLSSGQVVCIVIGSLLATVIVIAVVIAMVRRMGKYSP